MTTNTLRLNVMPSMPSFSPPPALTGPEQLQSTLQDLFKTLRASNAKQIQAGVVVAGPSTDCVICGWRPGNTTDYKNHNGTGSGCVAVQTCGNTMHETLEHAAEISSDPNLIPRKVTT